MAVADQQTVEDLILTDELPKEVQFVSVTSITGHGSTTQTQQSTPINIIPPAESSSINLIMSSARAVTHDVKLVFIFRYPAGSKRPSHSIRYWWNEINYQHVLRERNMDKSQSKFSASTDCLKQNNQTQKNIT